MSPINKPIELFFRQEGNGFPLVIVHGLYGSSDNWLSVARQLATNFKVIMVDQRNHGRSPHSNVHNYKAMENDMAYFFDRHEIEKAIILGHSMGGKTAMRFAAEHPERIKKLIIADIAPKDYSAMADKNQHDQHRNILRAMLETNIAQAQTREQIGESLSARIGDKQLVSFLLKNVGRNKQTQRFEWKLNVETLYNNLDEIIKSTDYQWFNKYTPINSYPVLFIKGMLSNYILPEDINLIRHIYPDARFVEIPNAGHWLHAEQPQLFIEAVSRFAANT